MSVIGFTLPRLLLGASLLALLAACGGGGGSSSNSAPPPATNLWYTNNPTATTGHWRLEVDPATNGTATVTLHVYGPTGTSAQGATLFLSCNASHTAWVQPAGASDPYALPGSALDLTQGPDTSVQLFKSHLNGSDLQVGAYQKTGTITLTAAPLFSVALELISGATQGTASPLATANRISVYLDGTGEHALALKVGTLVAQ